MKLYLVAGRRYWIPAYEATVFNERGQVVATQRFFTRRAKDRWVASYREDTLNYLFQQIVG